MPPCIPIHMEICTSMYIPLPQILGKLEHNLDKLVIYLHKNGNPEFLEWTRRPRKGKLVPEGAQDKIWVRATFRKCKE